MTDFSFISFPEPNFGTAMKNLIYLLSILAIACQPSSPNEEKIVADPLPSWNDGQTKNALLQFVDDVVEENGSRFVEVNERIAVFDNDGNLWSEKPAYFQLLFALDRLHEMYPDHPEWDTIRAFRLALADHPDSLKELHTADLLKIVQITHGNSTMEDFERQVEDWIRTAKHPRFDRPYTDLVYQPMLELINYLKANDFKVFIVSGGGAAFMRPWVEEVYGIPRHQVIGSQIQAKFEIKDGKPLMTRLPAIGFIDDKEGKPVGIYHHIGRKPILCSGNSDGDLAMMQWTTTNDHPHLNLLLHHTDSVREWAYDRNSPIGHLDRALMMAQEKGWAIIDMSRDWKVIYPFELN